MQAKLVPVDGGEPIVITRDVTIVGRGRNLCDILLQQNSISKLQCLIAKTDGLLFIRDLGSTNGTKVNGQRVTARALLPGDELAFASVKFRVHLGPSVREEEGMLHPSERTDILEPHDDTPAEEYESVDPEPGQSRSDVRLLSDDSAFS